MLIMAWVIEELSGDSLGFIRLKLIHLDLEQKMDMLAMRKEIMMKAQVQMMTPTPQPFVYEECGEIGHVVVGCPYTQALEEVNYVGGKSIIYDPTLIPTTKGRDIT